MGYKAYRGPSGSLSVLVGRLGGTTRITDSTASLVSDSIDLRAGSVADAAGFKSPSSWYTADPLYWTGSDVNQALRFTSVSIPQGATITSATLTVYTNANMSGASVTDEVRVYGEDVDNAPAISSAADALSRFPTNATTANVDWYVWEANGPLTNADQPVISPSISTIVQEIVNRPGWVSGNSMMFFVDDLGTGIALAMRSYFNGTAGTYPRLQVGFEYLA